MAEPIVRCSGLTHSYGRGNGQVRVLNGIDLDIENGEFLALMGPSGSGKTTLLNLIGGLDRVQSGAIQIHGLDIGSLSSRALAAWRAGTVGFVFQFYNLLPVLTARANVELPLLLTRLSRSERRKRARAALTLVGLEDRLEHKPNELSGGQQQRVAIARALVADPSLLVCDEPTGDLDRDSADAILELLSTLNEEHRKTIVMVTHDPKAAEYARTRRQMDKGRLELSA